MGFLSLVSGTNFVKMSGVGSPNLKIINNITFLQTPRFPRDFGVNWDRQVQFSEPYYNQKRFGEPTPLRPKIVPLTNGFLHICTNNN